MDAPVGTGTAGGDAANTPLAGGGLGKAEEGAAEEADGGAEGF